MVMNCEPHTSIVGFLLFRFSPVININIKNSYFDKITEGNYESDTMIIVNIIF